MLIIYIYIIEISLDKRLFERACVYTHKPRKIEKAIVTYNLLTFRNEAKSQSTAVIRYGEFPRSRSRQRLSDCEQRSKSEVCL